ncbi:MAG TPA: hypothetical protein PKC98_13115 [Candidatus Melainabacteria bacterium]|nr:hypothetical protein [Candidatus Melainabacteria bacterium]
MSSSSSSLVRICRLTALFLLLEPARAFALDSNELKLPINMHIETNQYKPKSPLEAGSPLLAPIDVKTAKPQSLETINDRNADQAKSLNLVPLPLIESADETAKIKDDVREKEKQQLSALWQATLANSPEINFVLQKLMPSSAPGKITSLMMRTLSAAIYGGVGSIRAFSPGIGGSAATSLGLSLLNTVFDKKDRSDLEKLRVTQVEQILLYQMVRDTADKLVLRYRQYKKFHNHLLAAEDDLRALKAMALQTQEHLGAAAQFTVEYTLRKQKRDLESLKQELYIFREGLVDLAGPKAVEEFQEELERETRESYPQLNEIKR